MCGSALFIFHTVSSLTWHVLALWAGFVGFALFFCLGMMFTLWLMQVQINAGAFGTIRSMMHNLLFRNMIDLRDDLSVVVGRIPLIWAGETLFLTLLRRLKYFISP